MKSRSPEKVGSSSRNSSHVTQRASATSVGSRRSSCESMSVVHQWSRNSPSSVGHSQTLAMGVPFTPSSSSTSRMRACSCVSPGSILPLGGVQYPGRITPGARLMTSRRSPRLNTATTACVLSEFCFIRPQLYELSCMDASSDSSSAARNRGMPRLVITLAMAFPPDFSIPPHMRGRAVPAGRLCERA
jgi:hypothetical protein